MRRTLTAGLLALTVVLAGCAGGLGPGSGTATPTATATDAADGTTTAGAADGDDGVVQFYVSDERNAIEQFEHLNVTITSVGFERAFEGDADETEEPETTTAANRTSAAGTATATGNVTTAANATATETTAAEPDAETESEDETAKGDSWVVRDVNATTVDLTELQGANATLIEVFEVPAGNYTTVFAHVSDVNGTLTTGERVNVKLPSQKLQVHTPFTVGPESSVDFVFDITVFEAGKSGKYILKPVVSESGTDVPIEKRGPKGETPEAAGERSERPENGTEVERNASALQASLQGPVRAGENVTVKVTDADGPVANATVAVNGARVGTTGAAGTLSITVPDAEELEVTVRAGDAEVEVERAIQRRGGGGNRSAT